MYFFIAVDRGIQSVLFATPARIKALCAGSRQIEDPVECVDWQRQGHFVLKKCLGAKRGRYESHLVAGLHPITASPCKSESVLLGCLRQRAVFSGCLEFYCNDSCLLRDKL